MIGWDELWDLKSFDEIYEDIAETTSDQKQKRIFGTVRDLIRFSRLVEAICSKESEKPSSKDILNIAAQMMIVAELKEIGDTIHVNG